MICVLSDKRFPHYLKNLKVEKLEEIYDSVFIKFSILIIRNRNYSILKICLKELLQNEPSISLRTNSMLNKSMLWFDLSVIMKLIN